MEPPEHDHDQSIFQHRVYAYIERLKQIDNILEQPVCSLFQLASSSSSPPFGHIADRERFPVWIEQDVIGRTSDSVFTRALCASTIQRVQQTKRRYPWHKSLPDVNPEDLWKAFLPKSDTFKDYVEALSSESYGGLNPLMAAQVFRVFLRAGEQAAHRGIGFLIFYAVFSSLAREHGDPLQRGAAIEPWRPMAYVTATCLLAIQKLRSICLRRATYLNELKRLMKELDDIAKRPPDAERPDVRSAWNFRITLDALQSTLRGFSKLTVASAKADEQAARMAELEVPADGGSLRDRYADVEGCMRIVLDDIGAKTTTDEISGVLHELRDRIVYPLRCGVDNPKTRYAYLQDDFNLRFSFEHIDQEDEKRRYKERLATAAEYGLARCEEVLKELQAVRTACASGTAIPDGLDALATINRRIAELLDDTTLRHTASWCASVVNRELAHLSAGDHTNFDPSELVCGIAVAVHWRLMNSELQVKDAVAKAIQGLRPDGSWAMGKPIFSRDQDLAAWPVTSDTMWMLTSAVRSFPDIDVADEAFFRHVDWLERTRIEVRRRNEAKRFTGWPSDRIGQSDRVHLEATAFAVNALLEIRELVEYRLWQLCEWQFTLVKTAEGLDAVAPVDMGAPHAHRLHRVLGDMVRGIQSGASGASYSLILHGPPGTSKTMLAKALAYEMGRDAVGWRSKDPQQRLVRITPADFTRLGEARVDSSARLIFDLLGRVRGVTILFDEIDDLLRQRTAGEQGLKFLDLVVPAMLNRLQDLRDRCPAQQICFLIATNYIDRIEPALLRPGRVDRRVAVVYPDYESRRVIVGGERWKHARRAETLSKDAAKAREEGSTERANELERGAARAKLIASRLHNLEEDAAEKTPGWPYLAIKDLCEQLERHENLDQIVRNQPLAQSPYGQRLENCGDDLEREFLLYVLSRMNASSNDAVLDAVKAVRGEDNVAAKRFSEEKLVEQLMALIDDRRRGAGHA